MSKCHLNKIQRLSPLYFITSSRAFSRTICLLNNYYDILKVSPNASAKEIKDAYFKLSKEYHPDLNQHEPKSQDRFIRLQEAYKILSNVTSKNLYDSKVNATMNARKGFNDFRYNHRSWQYPDFSQRDEFIRKQNKERMAHKFDEFNQKTHFNNIHEFNKYYSRPHNLSPDELARFYRMKKFSNFVNNPVVIIVAVFALLIISFIHSMSLRDADARKYTQRYFDRLHATHDPFGKPLNEMQNDYLKERRRRIYGISETSNNP